MKGMSWVLMIVSLVLSSTVAVARDLDQDEALGLRQMGVILPLEQLLHSALARYRGSKLIEADLEQDDGLYIYDVELLTAEGVVREIELNAATGELLKDKEED